MGQKSKPKSHLMPFDPELGPRYGSGQDNAVFQLVGHAEKPHLRVPTGLVLKINHGNAADHRIRYADERKAAESGIRYKKNKYEILKKFLGDFVPDTSFVLGEVVEGSRRRFAEYTVQKEVPRVSLHELTQDQRDDPKLHGQVVDLMGRLKYMYSVLGEVNARTGQGVTLDGKLDLGGISDFVRAESIDHVFDDHDADEVINSNTSPNLLVDPETMQLSCIDFDQGQWYPGMDEAKQMVFDVVQRHEDERRTEGLGSIALGSS